MSIEVKEVEFNTNITSRLKSDKVVVLPININDPSVNVLIYPNATLSLIKEFRSNGLATDLFIDDLEQIAYQDNRSIDWFAPTLFITSSLLSQNPELVNIAINLISNYLTDIFKGIKKDPTAKLTIVHRNDLKMLYTKINYDGPISGLSEIKDIIKKINSEK